MIILLYTSVCLLPKELIQKVSSFLTNLMWIEIDEVMMIHSPFGGEWWVRVVLIGLLIGGLIGVYRYRIFRFKNRQTAEFNLSLRIQELERQRFAKELHDGLGANLSLLRMYLQAIGDAQVAQEELKNRSLQLLAMSLDEIRNLIHDLHPRSLTTLGLAHSINELAKKLNQSGKLMVTFEEHNMPRQLSQLIEINLFRIAQELLQNAIKHAKATNIKLLLCYDNDALLHLTYRDNGQGIDRTWLSKHSGNGLINIQQRVILMKGTYQLESAKEGVSVEIIVPFHLSDNLKSNDTSCTSLLENKALSAI